MAVVSATSMAKTLATWQLLQDQINSANNLFTQMQSTGQAFVADANYALFSAQVSSYLTTCNTLINNLRAAWPAPPSLTVTATPG